MNKQKVAIYLRLSEEDKNKTNKNDLSESLKNQKNLLLDEINKQPTYELIDIYCDEDLSGAGTYRPEFERLINDCKNAKIDIILCKSQSRFSRDMEIIEKYLHNKFIEWNIRFISFSDNVDTNNKSNKKTRQINALVNEWYLEEVSNNIKTAFSAKMKNGEFISPFACFGYKISKTNNNKLEIDKPASLIVIEIFNLYLKGYGYQSIAKHLNDNNIPSPSHYKKINGSKLNILSNKKTEEIKWSSNSIKTILKNEIYIGNLIQGKRTTISYKNKKIIKKNTNSWIKIINTHPHIIDKYIFNKVNNIIKTKQKTPTSNKVISPLSNKVYCFECGKKMYRKTTSKHEYLSCRNIYCLNKKSIRYDYLNNYLLNKINNYLKELINTSYIYDILKTKTNNDNLIIEKDKLIKKLDKNKNLLTSIYSDLSDNIINKNQFMILLNNYNNNNKYLTEQIKLIKNKINSTNTKLYNLNKYTTFSKLNYTIINILIKNIYISNFKDKQTLKINWEFKKN